MLFNLYVVLECESVEEVYLRRRVKDLFLHIKQSLNLLSNEVEIDISIF
jgi:hypothetical protein